MPGRWRHYAIPCYKLIHQSCSPHDNPLHNTSTNSRRPSHLVVRATSLTGVVLDRWGTLVGYCTRNQTRGYIRKAWESWNPSPFINHHGRIAKCSPFILSSLYQAVHAACEEDPGFVRLQCLSLSPGQRPLCQRQGLTSLAAIWSCLSVIIESISI